jgi:hypothetical protein
MNSVKAMDKYNWKHNGRVAISGIGQRIYYNGRLDAKSPLIPGLKKTIIEVEKQNTFIVLYKMEDTQEGENPEPGTSGIVESQMPEQSVSGEEPTKQQVGEQPKSKGQDLRRQMLRKLFLNHGCPKRPQLLKIHHQHWKETACHNPQTLSWLCKHQKTCNVQGLLLPI